MNYLKIINYDTNNGKFFRVSVFLSGCGKVPKCHGCHNKVGWDFNAGFKYTQETEDYILELLHQPLIKGFSILGGEPMDNLNDGQLLKLVKRIKTEFPDMSIFCWTGYTYEKLINNKNVKEFLAYVDMLRDGEFILDQKDLNQYLQGSRNQRQVNVQESLKQNKVVLYME